MFSREGLGIDTTISTVYFVLNSDNNYELQSVATGASLPIVKRANGDDLPSNCEVYKLYVMTTGGLEEINHDGFSLNTSFDGKRNIEVSNYTLHPF